MSRRRPHIRPRLPIFLGCEGSSEYGYGALLNRLADRVASVHIHIRLEILQPGAGDPLALVQRAVRRIADVERQRGRFAVKAILLDRGGAQKNAAAASYATQKGINHLIWQDPDHEGFLLRHLPGCQQRRPSGGASLPAILSEWPGYYKGMSAQELSQRIDLDDIRAACAVEYDLRLFLQRLGLWPP
jgi:hypothetical protein